ncbi:mRNA N(3)-methylcytidine methyltransferase METTL8 isoform X2 [Dromiciops gliroides]|uniref:mRNA N(3)-methylcytidine methyltransferase METTL8 isoform X2 n=1 Tax=Dromiciops gliroides TaxID=33562 RepID=UPI001CC71BED|nr:mRNA N(3)-methylcytidine methyltransferase METTL8 isoform X2 [Dromiciops gliroides]
MNAIQRLLISSLRKRRVVLRFQSNDRPTVPLGSRILTDPAKVYEHNMWDHMEWTQEEEATAREKTTENSSVRVRLEDQVKYESQASKYWNDFYKIHKNKFFKDRNWLLREFPEILPVGLQTKEEKGKMSWDHVKTNDTDSFSNIDCLAMLKGVESGKKDSGADFTYSQSEIRSGNNQYPEKKRGEPVETDLFPGSHAAFRILEVGCGAGNSVFPILNALKMQGVVNRLSKLLKPGGMLLFRDHGRYDLTQLRFKKGCCLSENFYVRGDGTRAYFFTEGEVHNMFHQAGLDEKQNLVDRRLQVNRKEKVKMHRVWVQGKFQKPLHSFHNDPDNLFPGVSAG